MKLPTPSEVLKETEDSVRRQGRTALCQVVRTEGSSPGKPGWKLLVRTDGSTYGNLGGGAFEALVRDDAKAKLAERDPQSEVKRYYLTETAVRGEATGMVCGGLVEVFLEVLVSKPLLAICGGGPVGQALARNAELCDFDVLVADDREEFREPDLFPAGTKIVAIDREHSRPFLESEADRELYVAVVSRCWETDLAALTSILKQRLERLVYLGLMGSKRKVERVRRELLDRGLDPDERDLCAPIGLSIGADLPGELAVSILAEMIRVRRGAVSAAKKRDIA
ncbi:MAG: hypothetical protein GY769_00305 [bacterium]|nr:hypothetical protein [bacterium]